MEIGVPLLVHLHLGIFRAREGERKETSCIIERNRIEMDPIEISGEQVFSAKTSIVYFFLSLPFGRKRGRRWRKKERNCVCRLGKINQIDIKGS